MAAVGFDSVSKVYPGGVTAVSDLTLDIPDGRFVVLVGPSGCGKSTILRMVAGLERLTAGTISIGDRVVNDVPPRERNIAMVFQNYALYPHMTVRKNLAFGLRMRKVPKSEIGRRVKLAAEQLGISELLDRKPKALSGGQQQRVAVGRALVRQPQCFLLDEPLSNLDARLRVQMRAELKALHQRLATTTIHVTHDQEEAMMLAEQVVVLRDGKVQQVGGPLEIYRRPANRFVAEFVGSPTMNLIEGTLRSGNDGTWFDDGRGLQLKVAAVPGAAERRPAVLGIRPESLSPNVVAAGERLPCTVTLCEPLGDRIDIHATTAGGTTIVARVAAAEIHAPGDALQLALDPAGVHLFDAGPQGVRIELQGADQV